MFALYELLSLLPPGFVPAPDPVLPTDIITQVIFTNITQSTTYEGTLIQTAANFWKYKLEGISVPTNIGSTDEWKVEVLLNSDHYTIVSNCILEDLFATLSARTLCHGS